MDPLAESAAASAARPHVAERPPLKPIVGFVARVLLWAAVAFAAWHLAAKPISVACGWVGARVVESTSSIDSARIAAQARDVAFEIAPEYETARRARLPAGGVFDVNVTALPYTYGLPFFLALMLASHGAGFLWKAGLGGLAVVAVAGAGMGFEVLAQLSLLRTPSGESLFGFSAAMREAVGLAYRLSALVVPPLAPVVLWIVLEWRTMESLAGRKPR